jgi:hypothetical protein
MAKKPEGVDPVQWRAERAAHWRRINRVLNLLMLVAAGLLLWRYLSD